MKENIRSKIWRDTYNFSFSDQNYNVSSVIAGIMKNVNSVLQTDDNCWCINTHERCRFVRKHSDRKFVEDEITKNNNKAFDKLEGKIKSRLKILGDQNYRIEKSKKLLFYSQNSGCVVIGKA